MGARAPSSSDSECLSEDLIVRMVCGDASPAEEARARRHIDRCADCRSLLAEATRDADDAASLSTSAGESGDSNDATEAMPGKGGARAPVGLVAPVAPVLSRGMVVEGEAVGKYIVERVLGRGGMGYVVSARHADLGHLVAIKIMHDQALDDKEAVERFHREARALAQLRSEHTVRVIDSGIHAGRAHYIVMEHLEGANLNEILNHHRTLPQRFVVECIMEACLALEEAHALGIVHRDLKPHNLFYAKRSGARPIVRVLDFGLAKRDSMREQNLTKSSVILGTPYFMSPEQIRSSRTVDARSDVWALGATLYRLLCGQYPFDGMMAATVVGGILKGVFAPLTTVRHDVSPALSSVVARCLALSPAARYGSAMELRHALSRVYADLPSVSLSFDPIGAPDHDERTYVNEPPSFDTSTTKRDAVPSSALGPRTAGAARTASMAPPSTDTAASGATAVGPPVRGPWVAQPSRFSARHALAVFVASAFVFLVGVAVFLVRREPSGEPASGNEDLAGDPATPAARAATAATAATVATGAIPIVPVASEPATTAPSGTALAPVASAHGAQRPTRGSPLPSASVGSPNGASTSPSPYSTR